MQLHKQINFRMTLEDYSKIYESSSKYGMNISNFIRYILLSHVEKQDEK